MFWKWYHVHNNLPIIHWLCVCRYHFQSSSWHKRVEYKTSKAHVSLAEFQLLALHFPIMRLDHFSLKSTTSESTMMKLISTSLNTRCIPWKWLPFIRRRQWSHFLSLCYVENVFFIGINWHLVGFLRSGYLVAQCYRCSYESSHDRECFIILYTCGQMIGMSTAVAIHCTARCLMQHTTALLSTTI